MTRLALALATLALIACSSSEASGPDIDVPSTSEIEAADKNGVMQMQRDLLQGVADTLDTVTDQESAQNAVATLEAYAVQVEPLRARVEALRQTPGTADDLMAMAGDTMGFMGELNRLGAQFDRLTAIEGVEQTLDPVMTKIMGLFER